MAALDRRVQAIYDALDNRLPKNALKLCNSALEKFDSILVKSLKAIALVRTAKPEEARDIVQALLVSQSSLFRDPNAVHALMIAMRDLRMDKEVTQLYEAAHINEPGDLDILDQLFFCYVKEGSQMYAKQQQTAIKINKLDPCGKHAWWIVLSVILQAREGIRGANSGSSSVQLEPKKLMQLAESLVTRQTDKDKRLDGFEALLVLLDVLLAQGKDKEALDLITSSKGDVASMAAERAHLNAVLLMRTGDLKGAAAIFEAQLKNHDPDDWITLGLCLDCIMGGGNEGNKSSPLYPESSLLWLSGGLAELLPLPPSDKSTLPSQVHTSISSPHIHQCGLPPSDKSKIESIDAASGYKTALKTVAELIAMVKEKRVPSKQEGKQLTMRGPFLAAVEVARRGAALGLISEIEVASAALKFLKDHGGSLVSCAVDLRGCYTSRLGPEASKWLVEAIMADPELTPHGAPASLTGSSEKDIKLCRTIVCSYQVVEDLGGPSFSTEDGAVAYSNKIMQVYAWAEPLYFGLDSRERGPADELPVLAANTLITAAISRESDDGCIELLMQALLLLESCVSLRPHSAQIRLSLAALHTLLGCPEMARSHCRALDIKNIQLDSLASHHILPALLSFYSPPTATSSGKDMIPPSPSPSLHYLLRETLYLFSDHLKEASSTLRDAYHQGSYSKVLEFIAFRERVEASHTRALSRAEKQILEMKDAFFSDMKMRDSNVNLLMKGSQALLPLSELPVLEGPYRVRFNEDLSTRQPWYPPASSASLAPCFWWEERGKMQGCLFKGQGRVWWSEPFVSDDPSSTPGSPAHAYRASKLMALKLRWLLPHLLSHVFVVNVHKLQELVGMSGVSLHSLTSSSLPTSSVEGVSLLTLGAFSTLALSLAAPSNPKASEGVQAVGLLVNSLSSRVVSALEIQPDFLPGWVANLSSALITESLFSFCLCTRAFSQALRQANGNEDKQISKETVEAWKALSSQVSSCCSSISAVLEGWAKGPFKAGESNVVTQFALSSSETVDCLFDAAAVAMKVRQEQCRVAGGLAEAAHRLGAELSVVFD